MFQVGRQRLALDVRRVHEIVPWVHLQAVAGSPPWLAGIFIYRGQIVPVIDLHRLLGVGECPVELSTRIILMPHVLDGRLTLPCPPSEGGQGRVRGVVGLLASKVDEVRELQPPSPTLGCRGATGQPALGPVFVGGQEIIHLAELDRLLPGLSGELLSLVAKEPSA